MMFSVLKIAKSKRTFDAGISWKTDDHLLCPHFCNIWNVNPRRPNQPHRTAVSKFQELWPIPPEYENENERNYCKNWNCQNFCKSRTKKSSLYMLNFWVIQLGRDIFPDTNRATTLKAKFEAPSNSPYFRGILLWKLCNPLLKKKLEWPWVFSSWCENFRNFCRYVFFSGITALMAFNRNAKGADDGPCRYKGANDVLLEI